MPLYVLLLLSFLLAPVTAIGAFKSSADSPKPESAFNPVPLEDDIALPMPCGLQMILRAVHVPGNSLMLDRSFSMGIVNNQDSGRAFYERQFAGHIAAPFKISNLPFTWQQKLEHAPQSGTWYFIGKYETTRQQWEAVMNALDDEGNEISGHCPMPVKGMNQPVSAVSWYGVQSFLQRYNSWLLKNHPEDLPSFAGTRNIAFLRLPTEEEWEYAARGGSHVAPEWWSDKDFFPVPEGKSPADYAIYNAGFAPMEAAPVGSRLANPLGLHDTAGNVREMVDGFFRMSVAELEKGRIMRRLHGSSGGLLSKGGGFRSDEESIMPGSRDETPFFTANGAASASDLGFRVALGGINIPGAERMLELRKDDESLAEKNSSSQNTTISIDEHSDPLKALDAMIRLDNGDMKQNLIKIRALLAERAEAQIREENRNLERAFRGLLYQAETLRAFAYRYAEAQKLGVEFQDLLKLNLSPADREKAEAGLKQVREDLNDYLSSLEMGASYYRNGLENMASYPAEQLNSLLQQAQTEYGGVGVFNSHMRQNTKILEKLLRQVEAGQLSGLSAVSILRDILPASHFRILPLNDSKS